MIERIGDPPERDIGFRPDDIGVEIELNLERQLRQLEQLLGDRLPVDRILVGIRFALAAARARMAATSMLGVCSRPLRPSMRSFEVSVFCARASNDPYDDNRDNDGEHACDMMMRVHQRYPASVMA